MMSRNALPLTVLLVGLCVFGVALRFLDLGFPEHLTWDEHHFVKNARNYLAGRADWNDHPPLGKLLMALSMHGLGDTPFAFRLPSAVLGVVSIIAAAGLARAVFEEAFAALLAAAFVAADGFFICYSRTALLDGMLTALSLCALWAMTHRGPFAVLLAGALVGTAMAIKMSALVLVGPLMALALLRMAWMSRTVRQRWGTPSLFGSAVRGTTGEVSAYLPALALAGLTYLWWWKVGLALSNQPHGLSDAIAATQKMMAHHAQLDDWEHPLLSRWYTWAVPLKPILLRRDVVEGGMLRVMTSMGNPLIWWGVSLSVAATLLALLRAKREELTGAMLGRAWLLLAFVAYLSPWIVTNRDSYIYHYLPAYAVGVVLLAGLLAQPLARGRFTRPVLAGVCCVCLATAFYAPVWAQIPVSEAAMKWRPLID